MTICIRCGKNVEKANINKGKICKECQDARQIKNKKNIKVDRKDLEEMAGPKINAIDK